MVVNHKMQAFFSIVCRGKSTCEARVCDVFAEKVEEGLEVGLVPPSKRNVQPVTRRQLLKHAEGET
jgi:hypothetical protein